MITLAILFVPPSEDFMYKQIVRFSEDQLNQTSPFGERSYDED